MTICVFASSSSRINSEYATAASTLGLLLAQANMNAIELHELYKQRSTSETWIEQVKGHTMAGSTLTDDFWANDILWQLSVLAYNISVMMRQKKKQRKEENMRTNTGVYGRNMPP